MRKIINGMLCLLIAVTAFTGILFNAIFNYEVVQQMHTVNQLNLKHFQTCYNLVSGKPLEKINKCLSGSLSSYSTGDAFVVRLPDMAVIWDNSVDCKTGKQMYLTMDSICKLAYDPQSCLRLAEKIRKGYPSSGSWYFDGSKEIDDWIILPDEVHNMDGSLRSEAGLKRQYVVVQGAQTDEFMKNYKIFKYIINGSFVVILFIELLLASLINLVHRGTEEG